MLGVRHVYELVWMAPLDLQGQRNFGARSLQEVQTKLSALGLRLGMSLDRPSYAAAVTAALVEEQFTQAMTRVRAFRGSKAAA